MTLVCCAILFEFHSYLLGMTSLEFVKAVFAFPVWITLNFLPMKLFCGSVCLTEIYLRNSKHMWIYLHSHNIPEQTWRTCIVPEYPNSTCNLTAFQKQWKKSTRLSLFLCNVKNIFYFISSVWIRTIFEFYAFLHHAHGLLGVIHVHILSLYLSPLQTHGL